MVCHENKKCFDCVFLTWIVFSTVGHWPQKCGVKNESLDFLQVTSCREGSFEPRLHDAS